MADGAEFRPWLDGEPVLHVYGQSHWHAEAYIIGNRGGLLGLREAIDRALAGGADGFVAYVNDGEGFEALVGLWEPSETIGQLAVPYTDADMGAVESRADAVSPFDVPGVREAYKRLAADG